MASDGIYIRQFRPSDFPQIRALLFEGFVTSQGSVTLVAKRRFLFKFPTPLAYLMCGAGLTLLARADLSSWPSLGPLLSATTGAGALLFTAGLALFAGIQRAIPRAMTKFCEDALAADMHDIATHYRAPAAFFVAALPRSASPGKYGAADDSEEVVGYVGLEYLPEKDPHTAEVRRMIVSAAHRRHGIGERLMRALIAHAEAIPGLRSIELGTSEYQPGAQRLYERLGWTLFHAERVWEGPVNVVIRHFRRPVGGA